MEEIDFRTVAAQLRKPSGQLGLELGERLARNNATIYRHILRTLKPQKGENILEVGMGTATHLPHFFTLNDNLRYTGCDFSDLMVKEARRINEVYATTNKATFVCADASCMPFQDDTFHQVFTVNTIYFWDDIAAVFEELKRVLRPGGHLHIAVRPKHVIQVYPFADYGFQMYDKNTLVNLFQISGFSNIAVFQEKEDQREMNGKLFDVETLIVSGKLMK